MYQKLILDKISSVLDVTTPGNDDKLMQLIDQAGRVFVTGAGRSGLVSRFFAMRLTHSGYKVSMVGEIVTPSIQSGDLFIVIGGTETLLPLVKKAKSMGAKVAVISMKEKSPMAEMADLVIQVGKDESYGKVYEMPMGTVFELSTLVFLEATIAKIMHAKNLTEEGMRAIHANLE
jgi:6-phospho-3-hexuloisomerase